MKKQLLFILLIVSSFASFGQNFQWAKSFGGGGNSNGQSVKLDSNGNIYVMGHYDSYVDFDPDTGVCYLPVNGGSFISKINPSGKLIWAKRVPEEAIFFTFDKKGNVYISGQYRGKDDFDPDTTKLYMESNGSYDVFIIKLNSSGKFSFAKSIGGNYDDYAGNIEVDKSGYIYMHGSCSSGLIDFDPGTATYKLESKGSFKLKLDSSGNFISVKTPSLDYNQRAFDSKGNKYTAGLYSGKVDFDPDPSKTFYLTSKSNSVNSICILKLDSADKFVWAKSLDCNQGFQNVNSLIVDVNQNVYTIGYFEDSIDMDPGKNYHYLQSKGKMDVFISKLDSMGNFVWGKKVGGKYEDMGKMIVLDNSANVYILGTFKDTADFDPGTGKLNLVAKSYNCPFILKLNKMGDLVWAKEMSGTNINSFFIDKSENLFATGFFGGTADFDPNQAKYTMESSGQNTFILKLGLCPSPAEPISGPATFCGTDIKGTYSITPAAGATGYKWIVPSGASIDSGQNTPKIKVTFGSNFGTISVRPSNICDTTLYTKLAVKRFQLSNVIANVNPATTICAGQSIKLFGSGALNYAWSGGISNNQYFTIDTSTTYIVTGTDKNGCEGKDTISLTVYVKSPPLINGPATVCSGGKGIYSITPIKGAKGYTWKVPTYAVIDSGQNTSTLYVTFGNASAGYIEVNPNNACNSTFTCLNVSIGAPKIGIDVSPSAKVCKGSLLTLNGTGGTNYKWSGGIKNGVPFILDTMMVFTVTDSSSPGCTGKNSILLKVNPLPKVGAYSKNSKICQDSGTYLYGTGANTYTWSDGVSNGVLFKPASTKTYKVTGTDLNGCKGTNEITVEVMAKPSINVQPANKTGKVGDTITFNTSVSKSSVTFQWQQNGGIGFMNLYDAGPYSGVQTNTLNINSVALNQNNFKYRCIIMDEGCSNTTNTVTLFVKATGYFKEVYKNTFSIYPNPTTNLITIESDYTLNNSLYIITDQTGRRILIGELNSKINTVDISTLASGFYFLQIGEANKETFKILKQ